MPTPSAPRWSWAIGPAAGGVPTRILTGASGRRVTFRVDAACDAQFTINGRSAELVGVVRLAWDLWIHLEGDLVFRGRLMIDQGDINADAHSVTFYAIDYRGMLGKAITEELTTFTNVAQGEIAWQLVDDRQGRPGGDWGITNGIGSSTGAPGNTLRTRTFDAGKTLADIIGDMGRVENGMEWGVSPDLTLDRWYPLRGEVRQLVLDSGGALTRVTYTYSGDDYGNADLVTGSQTTTPALAETADVATDPRGRMERSSSYPTIEEQATLDDRAAWYLRQTSQPRPDFRVQFKAREWDDAKGAYVGGWPGMEACGLGDTVTFVVKDGWVDEPPAPYRIVELAVMPTGDDTEEVQAGLLSAEVTGS